MTFLFDPKIWKNCTNFFLFFQLWEPLYTFGRHIDPNFSYNHLEYQKLFILVTNFVTIGPSKANLQWVMCELTKLLWQNVPQNTSSSLILKMLSFGHGFYVNYWIVSSQICCPKLPNLQKKKHFLHLLPWSLKKNWGSYRSKNLLPSARAAKTLQFGHQFHADWFIQSREILKLVKSVIIAIEI